MLGWLTHRFRRSPAPRGLVWPTREAMWSGVLVDVSRTRAEGTAVVLVGHFRDTIEELFRRLREAGVPARTGAGTLDVGRLASGADAEVPIVRSDGLAFGGRVPEGRPDGWLRVIVAERYPLRGREDAVERAVASVRGGRVVYHGSLDDELLEEFGAPRMRELLARLGQAPDESLEHPMIERAIRNAQRKLDRTVAHDASADSARQWFAVNRPKPR